MCGGDGGVEDRAQERASVGHWFTVFEVKTCDAGYPSDSGKKKPPQDFGGVFVAPLRAGRSLDKPSAPDVAADHVAEQLPLLALELHQLKLVDRGEIGRRGIDHDAREQDFGAEVLEVGRLLHVVSPGE